MDAVAAIDPTARTFWRAAIGATHWRMLLLAAAMILGVIARVAYSWSAPFWFDETFSAVIAGQRTVSDLVGWCLTEITGPAYYMPLWGWARVFGTGDLAMRAPSILCSIGAPLFIWRYGHRDRDVRLFWAVFVLLWLPAIPVAGEARPYPQLFFAAVLQCAAFLRVVDAPTRRATLAWAAAGALVVLTHYYGIVISVVQGLILLARHRQRVLHWPAMLPIALAAGWTAIHLSFLLSFAASQSAAYAALPLSAVATLPAILFGAPLHGMLIIGIVVVSLVRLGRQGLPDRRALTPDELLALSGIVAWTIIVVLAFVRPGFAPRYLTATMPAVLFGLALWARRQATRDLLAPLAVVGVMALAMIGVIKSSLTEPDTDARHIFNLEVASHWIAAGALNRLVFFWDGPVGEFSNAARLGEIAGFFLTRDGRPVDVVIARVPRRHDPTSALTAIADTDPNTAILWIANDSLGADRQPRFSASGTLRVCHDFGDGGVIVTACRPR